MKTPTQQALIQLIESILLSASIAGLVSVEPLIAGTGPVDWHVVLTTFGLATAFSIAHSVAAYFKPSQPDLGAALSAIVDELEKRYGYPAQNAPQRPVAQPMASGYPQVPMNTQQPPTPPNPGLVWAPDVSMQGTTHMPTPPLQG
jgi:hypothetical protein